MHFQRVLAAVFVVFVQIYVCNACKGCVNVDESSWAKIRPKFDVILVKFDVAFPYGDKHETFTQFAADVAENADILVAEVAVKDYGEKDNEDFALRLGVSKDQFPALRLFKKNADAPVPFPEHLDFTVANLRDFLRDHTDIYLGLPGCVEAFDKIAQKFVKTGEKRKVLEEAAKLEETLDEKYKDSAKIYLVVMRKILENGALFVSQERERVKKLLKGKISSKKQVELNSRLNILRAFNIPNKDEL